MKRLIYLALTGLMYGMPALAEPDAAGCKDHPLFNRMPGYYIEECGHSDFDAAQFGHGVAGAQKTETVEGVVTSMTYTIMKGSKESTPLQIVRNYQNAVKAAGGKTMGDYSGGGCIAASSTGRMNKLCGSYSTTMALTKGGKEVWLAIATNPTQGLFYMLIAEREAMKQDVVVNELLDKINKDGFIALYINFDTGKATIKPDSFAQLDQVVAALKQAPDLKLEVGGHTDNVGTPASNQTLSDARAKSVMKYLTGKGIAATRLTAKGYGQGSPVADNRSEDGRAKNRRVELSKRG